MSSRQTLPEQAVRNRKALMDALRAPGDNTALVAQRARRLLHYKPAGADRGAWLAQVLPEPWHAEKATAALAAQNGGSVNGAAQGSSVEEPPGATTPRRQDRRQRRHRA